MALFFDEMLRMLFQHPSEQKRLFSYFYSSLTYFNLISHDL